MIQRVLIISLASVLLAFFAFLAVLSSILEWDDRRHSDYDFPEH